jgi:hypothetical protein
MWPFNKKRRSVSGTSFQEFLRTYVPAVPVPVQNPIEVKTVCPLCACLFQPGSVSADFPFCPDCSSEAMDIEVLPLDGFLDSKSLADFDDMLARWEAADGFRSEYKQLKSDRLRHLRSLKLEER